MKRLLLPIIAAISLHAEGMNTGAMIDSAKVPNFRSCSDLAKIQANKPVLLPAYTAILPESGKAAYSVKGPVDIDVKTGAVSYKIISSLTNDVADSPTFANRQCTEINQNELKSSIDQETQSIRSDIQRMYDSADSIYDQAQKESAAKSDGKTDSDVLGQALSGNVDEAQKNEEKVAKYSSSGNSPARSSGMVSPHLGFMARINAVNNELQTLIFLGSILITMIGLGAGYMTKKLQKRADHEDYISRFGLGVVMWFLLFAPANTYKYKSGEITQTRMQSIWGWTLNKGTGIANELAGAAHHEQMRYTINKSGGKDIEKQIASAVQEKLALENVQGAYEGILHQCIQSYKVNDLAMAIGDKKGGGKRYFPTTESMVKMGEEDVYSRYLQPGVNQEDVFVSLTACGKAEQEYRDLVTKKLSLQEKINAGRDTKFQEKYTSSAKQAVQDTTKAGWIGVAMLPVHHFIAQGVGRNIESKASPSAKKEVEESKDCSKMEMSFSDPFAKIGCYLEQLSEFTVPVKLYEKVSSISLDDYMQAVAQRSALMIVPGVYPVAEAIFKLINGIPIPGSGFFAAIISFYAASELGMEVIQNLPFLVLIPAISIVIAMYYAEVFLYSITIPYVAAYAFSRDQWGHLVKHAVRGIMIALKPAMIVISVYAAIYVSDVVSGISKDMINKQTSILMADNSAKHQTVSIMDSIKNSVNLINEGASAGPNIYENGGIAFSGFMGKFTIYIIQGFLFIIMAVVQVFIVIKIIISGPAMIMEMFGVRETDMASQMTESIASRGQKYEGGI